MAQAKQKRRLGEMLVDSGLMTPQHLEQALLDYNRSDMKLGQFPSI